jgi:hypothetical protein
VPGARARRIDFYVNGRRRARDRRAPFARTVMGPRARRAKLRITARASLAGERSVRATRHVRACRPRR